MQVCIFFYIFITNMCIHTHIIKPASGHTKPLRHPPYTAMRAPIPIYLKYLSRIKNTHALARAPSWTPAPRAPARATRLTAHVPSKPPAISLHVCIFFCVFFVNECMHISLHIVKNASRRTKPLPRIHPHIYLKTHTRTPQPFPKHLFLKIYA